MKHSLDEHRMLDELKFRIGVQEELGNIDHDLINNLIAGLKNTTPASLYSPTRKIYLNEVIEIVNSKLQK